MIVEPAINVEEISEDSDDTDKQIHCSNASFRQEPEIDVRDIILEAK